MYFKVEGLTTEEVEQIAAVAACFKMSVSEFLMSQISDVEYREDEFTTPRSLISFLLQSEQYGMTYVSFTALAKTLRRMEEAREAIADTKKNIEDPGDKWQNIVKADNTPLYTNPTWMI